MVPARLEDEDDDEAEDDQQEEEDALPAPCVLLVPARQRKGDVSFDPQ